VSDDGERVEASRESAESRLERAEPPPEPAEPTREPAGAPREPRPLIERIGLAAVALVLAILFGGVAAASWIGGELFLAVMGGVGCLMTLWVGALTLIRG
jgi:anti-sigma factor RsiW